MAGEDAELWTLIVPPPEALPPAAAQALRRVYGRSDGVVAIGAFMDLLPSMSWVTSFRLSPRY